MSNYRKLIFVIPGYRHHSNTKAYPEIIKILKKEGYLPIFITISWKQTTISENTKYFLKRYKQTMSRHKNIQKKKIYVLGFSFGAMIALLAATKVQVTGLVLCSLSPYFKEDLPKTEKKKNYSITTKRYQDFIQLHAAALAKKVKAKEVLMVYGKKEAFSLIKRVTTTYRQISAQHKYLISLNDTEHDIGSKQYLQGIHHAAKTLL